MADSAPARPWWGGRGRQQRGRQRLPHRLRVQVDLGERDDSLRGHGTHKDPSGHRVRDPGEILSIHCFPRFQTQFLSQVIDLRGSNLKVLRNDVFLESGLTNLQKIFCEHCQIGEVQPKAFRKVAQQRNGQRLTFYNFRSEQGCQIEYF
jgi:hypothetical protein